MAYRFSVLIVRGFPRCLRSVAVLAQTLVIPHIPEQRIIRPGHRCDVICALGGISTDHAQRMSEQPGL